MSHETPIVPPAHRGRVALFYKPGPPSKFSPGQLMIIENHTGHLTRNLRHNGYHTAALATRHQSPPEHEHAGFCGRSYACFYQCWEALITDEKAVLAEFPEVGTGFLDQLRQLSTSRDYRLISPAQLATTTSDEQPGHPIDDTPEPSEGAAPAALTHDEQQLAHDTAQALGMKPQPQQGELFA